jgi:hypothetical protein
MSLPHNSRSIVTNPPSNPVNSSHPQTTVPPVSTVVKACLLELIEMGFGVDIDSSRLQMYASAAAGNIDEAIEMIEEDREAAKELNKRRDTQQLNDLESQTMRDI